MSLQFKDSTVSQGIENKPKISLSSLRKTPKFSANAPVYGSLKVGGREYSMIYRCRGFFAVV